MKKVKYILIALVLLGLLITIVTLGYVFLGSYWLLFVLYIGGILLLLGIATFNIFNEED